MSVWLLLFITNLLFGGKFLLTTRILSQVACWNSYIGVVTCLKWAPRRAMFATASTVLTFWIPNQSKLNEEPSTAEAGHGE